MSRINCEGCQGAGVIYDAGHTYPCGWCKTKFGIYQPDKMPPINLPVSPSKGIEQVRVEKREPDIYDAVSEYRLRHPEKLAKSVNNVKHPPHYVKHPSGIECIDVVQHMGFNLGNAVKYIWRADLKNDAIEDMKKAIQYLEFEIAKRTK